MEASQVPSKTWSIPRTYHMMLVALQTGVSLFLQIYIYIYIYNYVIFAT